MDSRRKRASQRMHTTMPSAYAKKVKKQSHHIQGCRPQPETKKSR